MDSNLTRRDFLKSTATVAGGLILGFHLPTVTRLALAADQAASESAINAWLRIGTDNTITVLMAHSEMGQGVHTSIPMLIAEELEADWNTIKIVDSPIGGVYQNPLIKAQVTGGSTTIRSRWEMLRLAGAGAKEMLIAAAAAQWHVEPSACQAINSKVIHTATGKELTYGQLAEAAAKLTPPVAPQLKLPSQFKLIGKPVKRLDTPAKVNGTAIFGIDVKVPNMRIATVKQAPVFGSKVKSYNAQVAKNLTVVEIPQGIAVVADNYWLAKKGLDALDIQFESTAHDDQNTEKLSQLLQQGLAETGASAYHRGDVEKALQAAHKILDAEYSVPFLAHATMEPMTCTAQVGKDHCELWVPTQAQEWVRGTAAKVTGLPKEKIIIHTTYLGGGFGRRVEMDFVVQCLIISQKVGKPIKLIWSREEDMQHDVYRPMMRVKFTASLDEKGVPTALKSHIVGPAIMQRFLQIFPDGVKDGVDDTSVEGIVEPIYDIPHQQVNYVIKSTHVPIGFWRSVGHSQNAFFLESFIDEMAHASGTDPYQLRRRFLAYHPTYFNVLNVLAEKSHWEQVPAKGHYRGMAIHHSFGSTVGEVAEISVTPTGEVKVHRVTCVVDCGAVVNPNTVEAQMESAIIYGLGALKQAITIKNGQVEQSNFHNYPLITLAEAPAIEVHIIPSEAPPGGVGEPGTPPIIPAVTNALFAATGKRVRHLPL